MSEIYKYSFLSASGAETSLGVYEGKVLLIVNTATQCGLTPQFNGLEALHKQYEPQGLVVLGFPCNQFANQEPLPDDKLKETCLLNHGVTFPLSKKNKCKWLRGRPAF